MLNYTRIPAPRVTIVDPQTGIVSNEWFRFFNNLYTIAYAATGSVTPGTYGSATAVPQITVDDFGTITGISNVPIAIDASQIVSGTIASARISGSYTGITGVGTLTVGTWNATAITTPYGGTGLTSYTAGDTLYYASGSALSNLAIGASTYINTSSGTAPQWTDPSTITIGKATNLVGGAANRIAYQTAADTTGFIVAPTVSNTYLEWSGTAFQWTANPLGTVTSVAALTLGTTGTDLSSTVANPTTTPVITLNVPTASSVNRGALSAADWTTFNSKAPGVTFTTNYIPYGQGTTTLNQSAGLQFDGTNLSVTGSVGIGTTSPASALFVSANPASSGVPEINLENSQNYEAANYFNYKTELIFRGDKQNRYSSAGAILGPLASIATIYSNPTLTADSAQGAGALTFSTRAATATTSSDTLTERMRIDSAGNTYVEVGTFWQYAPAPTSKAAVATLTAAEVATGILNTTGTTYTVTLPTGTALDSQFSSAPAVNISFDWVVVNTASGTITIAVGASGMTSLGTLTVTTGVSARFRFRRTAANTYVLYRIG